jgi:hypothetical protein
LLIVPATQGAKIGRIMIPVQLGLKSWIWCFEPVIPIKGRKICKTGGLQLKPAWTKSKTLSPE